MTNQEQLEDKYSKKLIVSKIIKEVENEPLLVDDPNREAILVSLLKTNREQPIQNFVSSIISFGYTPEEAIQLVDDYSDKGIYTIKQYTSGKLVIDPEIVLPLDVIKQFEETTVLPPLVAKPKYWTNNNNGGYHTIKHNAILGSGNSHNEPLALDVLNKLQNIEWNINPTVLANFNESVCYDKDKENRIQLDMLDKDFYFMWQYDKRGRMYSKGYEINFQSSEYYKALLDFSHGEFLTEQGVDALLVAIANSAGYDKLVWDDRINMGKLLLSTNVELHEDGSYTILIDDIDEPILFTKYVEAYMDYEIGNEVKCPVSLDCTASGLQLMSVLTGCVNTAKSTNIIGTGKREDVYTAIVDYMNTYLGDEEKVDRKLVKKP